MNESTREEKVIEQSDKTLLQLTQKDKSEVIDEYEKLLNHYKKLVKRYEKTIKISDAFTQCAIKTNEKVIQTAKKKILDNIKQMNVKQQEKNKKISKK